MKKEEEKTEEVKEEFRESDGEDSEISFDNEENDVLAITGPNSC